MLGKMLLQGLAAAAIIAGAAVAYSASADNMPQNAVPTQAPQVSPDTGYIQPDGRSYRDLKHRDRHGYGKDERRHDDHARRGHRDDDHDDDDDDRHKRRHDRGHDRNHDRD